MSVSLWNTGTWINCQVMYFEKEHRFASLSASRVWRHAEEVKHRKWSNTGDVFAQLFSVSRSVFTHVVCMPPMQKRRACVSTHAHPGAPLQTPYCLASVFSVCLQGANAKWLALYLFHQGGDVIRFAFPCVSVSGIIHRRGCSEGQGRSQLHSVTVCSLNMNRMFWSCG